MASKADILRSWKEWQAFCETVQQATPVDRSETPDKKAKRIKGLLKDYAAFVAYYFPHYASAPCADFQIKAARKIERTPNIVGVMEWAREHAKSTHMDVMIPMWLKAKKDLKVMLIISKSSDAAKNLLADLQAEFEFNQRYINDFGAQVSLGNWQDGEFETLDGCAFFARGRGQSPRGLRYREHRPDYVVVDDLDDDEMVKNPDRVEKMLDWMKGALIGAIAIKRGRFIMAGNRIAKNSVLAKFVEQLKELAVKQRERGRKVNAYHLKVNALTLDGTPAWPENYTLDELQDRIDVMGYRIAQREYFNNPLETGTVFHPEWIQYGKLPAIHTCDHNLVYIDPSFKKTKSSDYKAVRHWLKKGTKLYLRATFCRQSSISAMVKWCYDYYESLGEKDRALVAFMMEGNFLQDIILDDFETEGEARGYMLPIMPDKRSKPDKFQRIEAISPLWERGKVTYNEAEKDNIDMKVGIEQTLAFEKGSGAHDDAPDADEGAIYLLQRRGRQRRRKNTTGRRTHAQSW